MTKQRSNFRFRHLIRRFVFAETWLILLVPFAVGTALAKAEGIFMPRATVYALIAMAAADIAIHAFRSSTANATTPVRKEGAGAELLPIERRLVVVSCLLTATIVALPVLYYRPALVPIAAIGMLVGAFEPTLPYRSRVLTKIPVLVASGPLLVNGSYYMQTGSVSHAPALLSIPTGLLIMNVFWMRAVRDAREGLGNPESPCGRRDYAEYAGIFITVFLTLSAAAVILNRYWFLLPLLTLILLPWNLRHAKRVLLQTNPNGRDGKSTLTICVLFGTLLCISAFL